MEVCAPFVLRTFPLVSYVVGRGQPGLPSARASPAFALLRVPLRCAKGTVVVAEMARKGVLC